MEIEFPDPVALAAEIGASELDHNLRVEDVLASLREDHEYVQSFETVEDLAQQAFSESELLQREGDASRLANELTRVRNAIADALWPLEIFVSVEILDNLLFESLKRRDGDAIASVLRELKDARVASTGLLVFGVHSLGMQGESFLDLAQHRAVEFGDASLGALVTSQTNSIERTILFLERAATTFGATEAIPQELVRHWRRSRQAEWLERNPLMVVPVAEASGAYYGNEVLLLTKAQQATVLISMLASAQPRNDPAHRSTLTTAVINNFETLEAHHYLVLSPSRSARGGGNPEMSGRFVPIGPRRSDLIDMSMLQMDFDPAYWNAHREEANRIAAAIRSVYRSYLRRGFDRTQNDPEARQARRWFESTVFFQRSFTGSKWRNVITLSTAFELLLHPPSKKNTSKLIRNALKNMLRGSEQKRYIDAFDLIYQARNEIMHGGAQLTEVNLPAAREAYVRAFVHETKSGQ